MNNASTTQNYKPRVLVADDSSLTRKSVQRILANDFEIIEAENGQQALGILYADENIHAVFVDFMMPEVDGFEVLKTLRESSNLRLRKLPVIMMSSHEDGASLRRKASVLGATDFISKPFDSLLLKTRARAHARLPEGNHRSTDVRSHENKADDKTAELMEYAVFEQSCPQIITDSYDQQQSVSLLYLKVDAFEALRQTTGKKEAATVVEQTGRLIAKQLRAQDKVAAVDADDFLILLPNTDANIAKELVKLIFRAVRKSHPDLGNMRISVTLSGGMVSNGPESGYTLDKLKDIAAERLQKAARKGGNQLVYADLKRQKVTPEKAQDISLVAALELLNEGETDAVNSQIPLLLEEVFPLLVVANARLDLGIDDALRRIQARLENSKPNSNRQLH